MAVKAHYQSIKPYYRSTKKPHHAIKEHHRSIKEHHFIKLDIILMAWRGISKTNYIMAVEKHIGAIESRKMTEEGTLGLLKVTLRFGRADRSC